MNEAQSLAVELKLLTGSGSFEFEANSNILTDWMMANLEKIIELLEGESDCIIDGCCVDE